VILALNGITARLELQQAADAALPQNDFANMKKGKPRERQGKTMVTKGAWSNNPSLL